ncbi:MAG: hypothetical protein IPG96_16355 [Proteobacteria bacterium]|nr:hypothetical protein [Pseudomonadota bacterium]
MPESLRPRLAALLQTNFPGAFGFEATVLSKSVGADAGAPPRVLVLVGEHHVSPAAVAPEIRRAGRQLVRAREWGTIFTEAAPLWHPEFQRLFEAVGRPETGHCPASAIDEAWHWLRKSTLRDPDRAQGLSSYVDAVLTGAHVHDRVDRQSRDVSVEMVAELLGGLEAQLRRQAVVPAEAPLPQWLASRAAALASADASAHEGRAPRLEDLEWDYRPSRRVLLAFRMLGLGALVTRSNPVVAAAAGLAAGAALHLGQPLPSAVLAIALAEAAWIALKPTIDVLVRQRPQLAAPSWGAVIAPELHILLSRDPVMAGNLDRRAGRDAHRPDLAIVGNAHREGISRWLQDAGWRVEASTLP